MTGRLWRHREFLLLWGGQTISEVGTAVSIVVLPLIAVVYLRANPVEVGLLAALEWVPWLIIGLPAGVWVDRSRKRFLMLWADTVRAVLLASVPVAAACGVLTIGQLFAVAFGSGVANVIFQVAYQAYLPVVVVDRDDLPEANAKVMGTEAVAHFAGPGVGGLLVQLVRAPFALFADVASYLVSAAALFAMRTSEPEPVPTGGETVRAAVRAGARFVRSDPLLRTMTIAPAIGNLFFGGFEAIMVLFLVRSVGLEPATVGLLVGLVSVGSLVGALIARPVARWLGSARAMWLSAALTAPAGLLIPFTSSGAGIAFFVVGHVALFVGILIYNVTISAFRQAYCPPAMLGRVVASMRFVLFGTIPVGAFGAGVLAEAIGIREAAAVLLAGNLLSAVVLAVSPLRTMRDLPDHPAGRPHDDAVAAHT